MATKNYYDILGISKSATQNDIKSAFRKLAMKYHPDKNPGNKEAEQKFKEISEAYDVLVNDEKRAAYDSYGSADFSHGMGSRASSEDFGDFSDFFSGIFNEFSKRETRPRKKEKRVDLQGASLQYNLAITLKDAFHGKKQTIKFYSYVACEKCSGTGGDGGKQNISECSNCKGSGTAQYTQGFFVVQNTCKPCHGLGYKITNPCKACSGEGRTKSDISVAVNIPPGVNNGYKARVKGYGEAGIRGGKSGNLEILISIESNDIYRREGDDLHCEVPVKFSTAALGGDIEMYNIDDSLIKIGIPEGTQTSAVFRLRAKGMPKIDSKSQGDLFVHVKIEIPRNLSDEQKEILKKFEETSKENSYPTANNFFSKLKNMFK